MKCLICRNIIRPNDSCCDVEYRVRNDISVEITPRTLERGIQFCSIMPRINLEFTIDDWSNYNSGWYFNFRLIKHHLEWQLVSKLL